MLANDTIVGFYVPKALTGPVREYIIGRVTGFNFEKGQSFYTIETLTGMITYHLVLPEDVHLFTDGELVMARLKGKL